WGDEPDNLDIPENEPEEIIEPEEIRHTADTWEVGMPWDPEWGEEPDYLDIPENEPEIVNFEYNICKYIATSNPNTLEITVSLTKPGTVYYVFEDISTMFGSEYLPSIEQVIQGNNALGNPNPKIEPNTGDDNFEFFTEAFIHGQFVITEANKEYMIVIEGPTFAEMKEETFIEAPSGFKGSIVAIDENGNKIIK
ncbi:MAG: hypothetical protein U9N10_09950, partial [Bacillota bacterium]|nr:hypothetical protein [Bacillota bacterium]